VLGYSFKLNASALKVKRDKPKPLLHEACQNNQALSLSLHVNCFVCVKALVLDIRKQWSARREQVRNSEYVAPPMTEKLVYCAKATPPTHVPGCQCPLCNRKQCNLLSYFSASQQPWGTSSCGLRARKGPFSLPRAHMHTHAASERADTHICLTRKRARHLPDILCGLTRTRTTTAPKPRPESRASKNARSPRQRGPLRAPTAKLYR
jgi:hypothetical protein